jgi:hypothetical protein
LQTTVTGKNVFKKVSDFFEEHGTECAVCTDMAPSMLGCRTGFHTLIKLPSSNATDTHCTIQCQVLDLVWKKLNFKLSRQ